MPQIQFTYNNFISLLKVFSDNHYQIKRFGSGEIYDIEELISDSSTFPLVWRKLNTVSYPDNVTKEWIAKINLMKWIL